MWDPDYRGKVAIIDDWHTAMAMVALRAGITDVNTDKADDLDVIQEALTELSQATKPKVTVSMYNDLPVGPARHQPDVVRRRVNAQYYLPKGQPVDVLRYWFPDDGMGLVDNDLMMVLSGGKNPVLAHLFLDHMLDEKNSLKNFGYIGYQPPQNVLDTERLVADGYLPENLATAAVREEWFDVALPPARARRSRTTPRGTRSGSSSRRARDGCAPARHPGTTRRSSYVARRREADGCSARCWRCPGSLWLLLFFVAPLYVVLAVVFGGVDPVFRTVIPVWNPVLWSSDQPIYVLTHIVGDDGIFGPALLRTAVYVFTASVLCLVIAFPIAYYVARLSGRWKGLLLTLLIAPFWISYMMRMLAWVNLLANDGLVNRVISLGGVLPGDTEWLSGKSVVVILGLVYGYVPYMIIPLYAGLDRLPADLIEGARDLGANRFSAFWRVTWPMSRPVVVASVLLTCLPMLGDYFTSDLLSGSPSTSMVGNLINNTVLTPGQTGQAGAFVLLVLIVSLLPMLYYVRSVSRNDGALA